MRYGKIELPKGQIKFPATQNASSDANTLDDYEEGNHTMVFSCDSGSITPHGTYNNLSYTKVGNTVFCRGYTYISSVSSPSGALTVSLPFTAASINSRPISGFAINYGGVNALGAAGSLYGRIDSGASVIEVVEQTTTTSLNDVADHIKSGTVLLFCFQYKV